MKKIEFEDGELVQQGYVMIDGVKHEIIDTVYNGKIPLSAYWLNEMQDNIEEAILEVNKNTEIETIQTQIGNIQTLLDSINGEVVENVVS